MARALSVYMAAVALGSGFAYILSGPVVADIESVGELRLTVLSSVESWEFTLFVLGLAGLLMALSMATTVREPPRLGLQPPRTNALPFGEAVSRVWEHRRPTLSASPSSSWWSTR